MMGFYFSLFLLFYLVLLSLVNPLSMCVFLVFQSFLAGWFIWSIYSKWLGISLIFVFVGGMMVVFIYITSMISSEKFVFMASNWSLVLSVLSVTVLLFFIVENKMFMNVDFIGSFSFWSYSVLYVFLAVLVMALFLVVKWSESFKGALARFL